jgi:hypothetical protein
MTCPKCGAPRDRDAPECARCGVVFAKFAPRPAPDVVPVPPDEAVTRVQPQSASLAVRAGRVLLLAALAVWTWHFARAPMGVAATDSFLHLPNLVFHEAGHVIFSLFGRFMSVLGGSLLQVAVPALIAVAFLRQRQPFGAAVCVWWAGQSLVDLAPYIADARALQLVLLGGQTGAEVEGHDWEYLLTELGWLHRDRALGTGAHWLGLATMAGALIWGLTASGRAPEEADSAT